jgi:hypothetical protein
MTGCKIAERGGSEDQTAEERWLHTRVDSKHWATSKQTIAINDFCESSLSACITDG